MLRMRSFLLPALCLLTGCLFSSHEAEAIDPGAVDFARQSLSVDGNPAALAAADLDGDEHLDLVVASEENHLEIFRGDGRGNLFSLGRAPAGEDPTDLALADIDGDKTIDIVVANHDTDYLTILLGDGKGAFHPAPNSPLRIAVAPHPHAVKIEDLDNDGMADLVVDDRAGQGLRILRGTGGGAFESPGILVGAGGDPYLGMDIGDLNRDGRLDLVTPNPRAVGILLGEDPGTLAFAPVRFLAVAAPFAVALADLNGDRNLDVVAASDEGSSLVEFFLGDGRGEFQPAGQSPLRAGRGGKKIAPGDFDGNGVEDVAITSYQSSEVLVIFGGSDAIHTTRLEGGEHPWGLAAADLDEDGKDDLVIADAAHPRVVLYLSRGQ